MTYHLDYAETDINPPVLHAEIAAAFVAASHAATDIVSVGFLLSDAGTAVGLRIILADTILQVDAMPIIAAAISAHVSSVKTVDQLVQDLIDGLPADLESDAFLQALLPMTRADLIAHVTGLVETAVQNNYPDLTTYLIQTAKAIGILKDAVFALYVVLKRLEE